MLTDGLGAGKQWDAARKSKARHASNSKILDILVICSKPQSDYSKLSVWFLWVVLFLDKTCQHADK